MASAHNAAGAAISQDRELLGAYHDGVLRRRRRNRPRLSHDPDRARRVRHQRRRLRRIHQPRRGQQHHGASEAEPQQHGGARGGHGPAAAGALRAARRGGAPRGRSTAGGPTLRVVLPELHVVGARHSGAHRLAHPQHAAPALDARGSAAGRRPRRASHRDAGLDRPRPPGRAQPRARRRPRGPTAQQLPRRGGTNQRRPGAGQPAGQHRSAHDGGVQEPDRG